MFAALVAAGRSNDDLATTTDAAWGPRAGAQRSTLSTLAPAAGAKSNSSKGTRVRKVASDLLEYGQRVTPAPRRTAWGLADTPREVVDITECIPRWGTDP